MLRLTPILVTLVLLAGCLDGGDDPGVDVSPGATPTGQATSPTASPTAPPTAAPTAQPTPPATPTNGPTPSPPENGTSDVREANLRFARALARILSEEAAGENLVMSPYSVATALQMIYGGADGSTRDAMRAALRLAGEDEAIDLAARDLLDGLTSADPNVTLRIGNSVWTDRSFLPTMDDAFAKRAATFYRADAFNRDFRDAATVGDINGWASDATEGKIPSVLDRINDGEIMFLLNAVYFKGSWTGAFNTSCTHDADFTRDDDTVVSVDMMCDAGTSGRHAFDADEERTVARIPYGDGRFAMYLVLPPEGTPLDDFLASWDGDVGNASETYSGNVRVQLPRLKLATRALDLRPALTDLGMGIAFTDQADFTRLGEDLMLTRATHDAILEMDEQGTVAAAVTTIGVGPTSMPMPPTQLVFDRPFAFLIRDDATGTVLFSGKVHDPTQE